MDHKIFLTESGIQNFIEYYELDEIKQRGYQRQIQIRDINILDENIILYLAECNAISFYRDDTHNSATLYNLLSYCSNFTNMFLVLAVVFIIILFISLIYFSINNVHKNKQNIGLLASYGLNKKNICINYMLPNLIVLLVAIVPTIVFGNLIIYAMNKQLMITQCIDFSIYNFNLLFCFVGVVISSFIIIILTLIPINKYLQKDLKDIIYLE